MRTNLLDDETAHAMPNEDYRRLRNGQCLLALLEVSSHGRELFQTMQLSLMYDELLARGIAHFRFWTNRADHLARSRSQQHSRSCLYVHV
jgi:hypothetical protein